MSVYPPPNFTEAIGIFNPINWENITSDTYTQAQIDALLASKIDYPTTQGAITISNNSIATTQTSGDNSTKLATTAFVANALTSTIKPFTITSNAVGTNTWTFNIPASYGRSFTYTLYSDTTPTYSSQTGQPKPMYGFPTINNSFFSATGIGILQYYQSTSSTQITYCAGFQQNYTITAGGSAYMMNIASEIGTGGLTWVYTTNGVNDNANCPPTANAGFTTTYTLSSPLSSVASCFVKLVGIVIAS